MFAAQKNVLGHLEWRKATRITGNGPPVRLTASEQARVKIGMAGGDRSSRVTDRLSRATEYRALDP